MNKHATEVPASAVPDLKPDHEHITQHRRAKIVCTLGPSVDSLEKIQALIGAGMNVARLNCSHGDWAAKRRWISSVGRTLRFAASGMRRRG